MLTSNKNKLIKEEILKLYKKYNPSVPTNFKKLMKINEKVFLKLSFPLRFFKNLTVGDFACGTGEFCMLAARNKAKVQGFDFNKISIDIAKKNSKKLKIKNCKFYTKEFFQTKKKFDMVICTAALHHLPDPYKGLKYLKSRVKKDGFLFVSFGLNSSNIVHNILKLIVRNWGKKIDDIKNTSKFLFKNHIDRCVKFGLREEDNVIADQFVNNQHHYLDLRKVHKILDKEFVLHSSWPPKFLPLADSINNISTKKNNLIPSELLWSTKTFEDSSRIKKFTSKKNHRSFIKIKNILNNNRNRSINEILKQNKFLIEKNNFNFKDTDFSFKLNNHITKFYLEVNDLFLFFKKNRSLIEAKKHIDKKKYLFKGSNGLGLNYFMFKKK